MTYTVAWVKGGDMKFADTESQDEASTLVSLLSKAGFKANMWEHGEPEQEVKAMYNGYFEYRD